MARDSPKVRSSDLSGPQTGSEDELLRFFIESTVDYAFVTLDPNGHITSWNRGAERLKGYRADEILGQHFSIFYPQGVPREQVDARLDAAAAEGHLREEGGGFARTGRRSGPTSSSRRSETGMAGSVGSEKSPGT